LGENNAKVRVLPKCTQIASQPQASDVTGPKFTIFYKLLRVHHGVFLWQDVLRSFW